MEQDQGTATSPPRTLKIVILVAAIVIGLAGLWDQPCQLSAVSQPVGVAFGFSGMGDIYHSLELPSVHHS